MTDSKDLSQEAKALAPDAVKALAGYTGMEPIASLPKMTLPLLRDAAIEAAARHIYEAKGKRLGKDFVGWNREPDHIKAEWRQDVRETIDAYERARG